jgi:phage baseplate assembly protein W
MVYDVEAVKASIRNILMWRVGENVIRPQFGHNIHRSMYEQLNDFNRDKVCEEIKRAIEDNEPRAEVLSVSARSDEDDAESSRLRVRVVYKVIGSAGDGAEIAEESTIEGK